MKSHARTLSIRKVYGQAGQFTELERVPEILLSRRLEDKIIDIGVDIKKGESIMDQPMLGIFWYEERSQQLIGVYMMPENEIQPDHQGKRTFPLLHVDAWEDLYNQYHDQFGNYKPDDLYPDEQTCPYKVNDYTQVPRGRVFSTEDGYQIYVGDWIRDYDYDYIVKLIETQFALPSDETDVKIDPHWNIGCGWGE